jgi:hypothetical protein
MDFFPMENKKNKLISKNNKFYLNSRIIPKLRTKIFFSSFGSNPNSLYKKIKNYSPL